MVVDRNGRALLKKTKKAETEKPQNRVGIFLITKKPNENVN
jgi:hypothetical protein